MSHAKGTILVFGDSISAAYGMEADQGWVSLLAQRVEENGLTYDVVNASVSGETTGGGVVRLPKTLELHQPKLLVLELGGNDGLRGYPIDKIRQNLERMIDMAQQQGADVLLIGMVLPPNYGRRYTNAFEELFADIAGTTGVGFLPYLLDGVETEQSLIQNDGIHPRREAQPMLLEEIWPHIVSALPD